MIPSKLTEKAETVLASPMTPVQAAELVLDRAVGPDEADKPRLITWLTTEADESTVLRHLLEASITDLPEAFAARTTQEHMAHRETQMDHLVAAAVALLRRFR